MAHEKGDVKLLITNRAVGKMIDHAGTEIQVRDLEPFFIDEKPDVEGKTEALLH